MLVATEHGLPQSILFSRGTGDDAGKKGEGLREREREILCVCEYLITRNSGTGPVFEFYHFCYKAGCTNKSFKLLFFLVAHIN